MAKNCNVVIAKRHNKRKGRAFISETQTAFIFLLFLAFENLPRRRLGKELSERERHP